MKVFANMKSRWYLPALAALSVLGTAGGYAAHVYASAEEDCCAVGAACCKPGAPCCEGREHSLAQR